MDWRKGGWTGSINAWVNREMREHRKVNEAARDSRYTFSSWILHKLFDGRSFEWCIIVYLIFLLACLSAEAIIAHEIPSFIPTWASSEATKSLLTNVASYLITAQVGVLGVVSISVGLVTIIAGKEGAATDVKVYYHESMAFGVIVPAPAHPDQLFRLIPIRRSN